MTVKGCNKLYGTFMPIAPAGGKHKSKKWATTPPTDCGANGTACSCKKCSKFTSSVGGLPTSLSACWPATAPQYRAISFASEVTALTAYWESALGFVAGIKATLSDGKTVTSGRAKGVESSKFGYAGGMQMVSAAHLARETAQNELHVHQRRSSKACQTNVVAAPNPLALSLHITCKTIPSVQARASLAYKYPCLFLPLHSCDGASW
jgi:hypothetical protein